MAFPSPYIAILDVGHGNATVIRDGDAVVIIDCGAKSSGLNEFLNQEGITEIEKVYISHADIDHIGGLVGLISTGEFVIKEIYFNSDGTKGSDAWEDFAYVLDQLHESGDTKFIPGIARSKDKVMCGSVEIEIVGPTPYLVAKGVGGKDNEDRSINSNSISASFRLYWNGSNLVYIAGDIDQIGLDDVARHAIDISSPVLVFPHHGGKAGAGNPVSFAEQLCNIVKPQTIVFSIGRSKHENPRPDIVKAVRAKINDVRISCTQLSKNCMKKLSLIQLDHLADVYSQGREDFFSCGGTFIIRLNEEISHLPEVGPHQTFIKAAAATPLCI